MNRIHICQSERVLSGLKLCVAAAADDDYYESYNDCAMVVKMTAMREQYL